MHSRALLHVLCRLVPLLLLFATAATKVRAQEAGNVSNLTLIDTLNPDLEVLAATIGSDERDQVFWQLNPSNRRGVFMSKGPILKTSTAGARYQFDVLPRVEATKTAGWTVMEAAAGYPEYQPLFFWDDERYMPLPQLEWLYGMKWKPSRPNQIVSWHFLDSQWGQWVDSLNDPGQGNQRQVELYKRHELPRSFSDLQGGHFDDREWVNNYRNLDPNASKLVIVLHGWQPAAHADPYIAQGPWFDRSGNGFPHLLESIHDQMDEYSRPTTSRPAITDWDLYAYNWSSDATTGPASLLGAHAEGGLGSGVENGTQAAEIGYLHGLALGKLLADHYGPDLDKVHFIAHSAGTWVAYGASRYLQARYAAVEQQVTLLDPFNPEVGVRDWPFSGGENSVLGTHLIDQWPFQIRGFQNKAFRFENAYSVDTFVTGTNERYWRFDDKPSNEEIRDGVPVANHKVGTSSSGIGAPGERYSWDGHGGPVFYYNWTVAPDPGWKDSLPGRQKK